MIDLATYIHKAKLKPKSVSQGFTLVELIVTIAVLAIALMTLVFTLRLTVEHDADPLWQSKSVLLATSYTEEILARRYDEQTTAVLPQGCLNCTPPRQLGPDSERRQDGVNSFDDIDDYHGLDEAPRDPEGYLLPQYQGYRVQVRVGYAGRELGLSADEDAKSVRVDITPPGQKLLTFVVYQGNHRGGGK